ncbi:hypothetical protein QJS04_geneDACA022193 [Acorus gramineus]|uniref:C2H2-type domain-containing protein n=1 Tax=Acorus gramineus TaxID=55184 RepID=A0AAV9BE51_ACOGR|nr:hypothetical protein QJS04_geneDACA022193 [Acorus gramineus]
MGHKCPYCPKVYTCLQAFGGHQTAHRREIEEMRRKAAGKAAKEVVRAPEAQPEASNGPHYGSVARFVATRPLDLISRVGLGPVGLAGPVRAKGETSHHGPEHVYVARRGAAKELDLISKFLP